MTDGGQSSQEAKPPRRNILQSLAVYFERRSLVMLGLGFAAGLPYLLIFDTLSAWMSVEGISLATITFFSLATLSYAFKFLWAPLVDRVRIPVLSRLMGHRRSWMLVVQAIIIFGIWLIAGSNPSENLALVAVFAVMVGFASATQDIVIDAWRIEAVDESRAGTMAAAYQFGWRIAMFVAGAIPLLLADHFGWAFSYTIMAVFMLLGVGAVLFAPRENEHIIRPLPTEGVPRRPAWEAVEWAARLAILVVAALIFGSGISGKTEAINWLVSPVFGNEVAAALSSIWRGQSYSILIQVCGVAVGLAMVVCAAWPVPGVKTLPGTYFSHAFGDPLRDFFGRFGKTAGLILALICLYRLSDFVLNIMNPFYLELGFSGSEIAYVRKGFGVIAITVGVFCGGLAIARWGLMKSLIFGAFAGPISNLVFVWLATQGPSISGLTLAIGVDNFSGGFSGTCLIAYMSSLTSIGFTATQYAFFSSLYSLPGKIVASVSGRIVEGAAISAERGSMFSGLRVFFKDLPAVSYVESAAALGVSPASYGVGYLVFFCYSWLIGAVAVFLAIAVARSMKKETADCACGGSAAAKFSE